MGLALSQCLGLKLYTRVVEQKDDESHHNHEQIRMNAVALELYNDHDENPGTTLDTCLGV